MILEGFDNLEIYLKIFVAIVGAIATLRKLRESFASIRRKQELKLDLEILEKLKASNSRHTAEIQKKIDLKLNRAFEDRTESFTNFFTGIAVFIGFGFWSVDLFQNADRFNGWTILTLLFSLLGLATAFGGGDKKEKEVVFYQIGFYDRVNFQASIIIFILTGILTPTLIIKLEGFSFWYLVTGLFFFISLVSLLKRIKRMDK